MNDALNKQDFFNFFARVTMTNKTSIEKPDNVKKPEYVKPHEQSNDICFSNQMLKLDCQLCYLQVLRMDLNVRFDSLSARVFEVLDL